MFKGFEEFQSYRTLSVAKGQGLKSFMFEKFLPFSVTRPEICLQFWG